MITTYAHHVNTATLLNEMQVPERGVVTHVKFRSLRGRHVYTRVAEGDDAFHEITEFYAAQIADSFTKIPDHTGRK